ncbi:MAG: nucleotidyl transferase AbiEii/AbiGii toxin family protein [Chthoniobacterales bacterium]
MILRALNDASVRALVVDGLAVNAHGYLRFTKDADLAIELVPENIQRAFRALATLGYQPRVPITAAQFADPILRESWVREKGMKVLQFYSDAHRETPIDVFVIEPFNFEKEYPRAMSGAVELQDQSPVVARYVAIPALIAMKQAVGRPQDLDDVQHLRWIQEEKEQ